MTLDEHMKRLDLELILLGLIAKYGAPAIIDSTRFLDAKRRDEEYAEFRRERDAALRPTSSPLATGTDWTKHE